jgi:nicotinic acetylcholine receptor
MTRAKIDYEGNVLWEPPAIYKSSCTINVEYFPFDVQHCTMKFGSWTYDGQQVDLIHASQTVGENESEPSENHVPIGMDLTGFYPNHEWDIMSVPAQRSIFKSLMSPEFYPDITFHITLRRKTLFYTCNLIIPCVGISFLTVLTFYLPSESEEKISLCISILLSLTVFVLLLNELIPPTSLVVPLIGKYLLFTVILVTISVTVTVVVLNVNFRSPSTHCMPPWTKRLFLNVLPKLLLMKRPPVSSSLSASFYMKEFARSFLREKKNNTNSEGNNSEERFVGSVEMKNMEKNIDKPFFKSLNDWNYYYHQKKAIKSVHEIVDHFRVEDETKRLKQEWKYVALVCDRLLLVIFTLACFVGTSSIILQAPSFYDKKIPIDKLISKNFI